MICYRKDDWWELQLNEMEGKILADSLTQLGFHYQTPLADLPEKLSRHWRGRITGNLLHMAQLKEAQQQLEEERLTWRNIRFAAVQNWLSHYQQLPDKKWMLALSREEMDLFLSVVNDRRLTLASAFDLTEADIDKDPQLQPDEKKRYALWEIHFLGFLQENCLASMMGS